MYSLLSILALVSATATLANTHAILVQPAARPGSNGGDNLGIKIPSPEDAQFFNTCGNAALQPGAPQATVAQGRQLQVRWDITIDHVSDPGVTVGLRCAGERDFVKLASGVRAQDLQAQVTIPRAAKVGNCELQWLWTSLEDGGSYIACSDIAVTAGEGGNDAAAPAPPAPAPPAQDVDELRKKQNKNRGGHQNGGNRGGNNNNNNNKHKGGNRGGNHNNNRQGGGKNKHKNRPQPPATRPIASPPCTSSVVRTQVPPSPTPTRPCTTTQAPPPPARATTTPCTTSSQVSRAATTPCTTSSQVSRAATTPCTTSGAAQRTAVPTQAADYNRVTGQSTPPEVPAPAGPGGDAPNPIDQPLYSTDPIVPDAPATSGEQAPTDPANGVKEQSAAAAEPIKINPAGEDKASAAATHGAMMSLVMPLALLAGPLALVVV